MRSSRLVKKLALALAGAALLLPAGMASAEKVSIHLIVSHASSKRGPMEAPKLLPSGFTPTSHKVLEKKTLKVEMQKQVRHQLPNGKQLKLRPTEKVDNHLKVQVEFEGAMNGQLRIRNHKRVTIRDPQTYDQGNLLVHIEPRF